MTTIEPPPLPAVAAPDDLTVVLRALREWLTLNKAKAVALAIAGAIVGAIISVIANSLILLYVYDGYHKMSYGGSLGASGPATGEGNVVNGGLIWTIGSALVFTLLGYWWNVGTARFFKSLAGFPATLGLLLRRDGAAIRIHLLWGAVLSLATARWISPWLGGVMAVALVTAIPSLIGRVLSALVMRIWYRLAGMIAPTRRRSLGPTATTVGILGAAIALAATVFIKDPSLQTLLAIVCAVLAVIISAQGTHKPAGTTLWLMAVALGGAVCLALERSLRADDGGLSENGGSLGNWLKAGGITQMIPAMVPAAAAGGLGGGLGAPLGLLLSAPPPLPPAGGAASAGGGAAGAALGGPPNSQGDISGGQTATPADIERINNLNQAIEDPGLYGRIQSLIDQLNRTGRIDPSELNAIDQAQQQLADQRHSQIVDQQQRDTDQWNQDRQAREAAEQAQDAANRALQSKIDRAQQLVNQIDDPARQAFLQGLLDRNSDPSKIDALTGGIHNELLNNVQRNADDAAAQQDTAAAYQQAEDRARAIRDRAIQAEGLFAGFSGIGQAGNIALSGVMNAGRAASDGADLRTIGFEGAAGMAGAAFPGNSAPGILVNAGIGGTRAMLNGETDPEAILANALLSGGEGVFNHYKNSLMTGAINSARGTGPGLGDQLAAARDDARNFFGGGEEAAPSTPTPSETVTPGGPRPFTSEPEPGYAPPERSSAPSAGGDESGAPAVSPPPAGGDKDQPSSPAAPSGSAQSTPEGRPDDTSGGGALTPAERNVLDRNSAEVSNVLGPNELDAESAFVKDLQKLRDKGAITQDEYNNYRERAIGAPIADIDIFDPFAQYRRPGNPPWTPQVEGADCSVAAAVNTFQKVDPDLRYEDAEAIINKYRDAGGARTIPSDQMGPALDELTYNRGLPPSQPVSSAIGTHADPAVSAAALQQFMANHPEAAVNGWIQGHVLTITGVNPDGTVHVIEPTYGHADLPPDKILWQYCHIVRGNAGGP